MNLAAFALRNRTTTLVLTTVMLVGGLRAFDALPRLEDPEFTIKEALVVTPYAGASAAQVEEEVTDKIEIAVQQLGQLKEIESKSDRGLSTVTVRIKDKYDKDGLPQVWDELRRKVSDAQGHLPPGAGPSLVVDDYGDVYGVFLAIHGAEYSYAELREVAKLLRRELLLVQDVAKIEFWGERTEAVYIEPSRERMAELGIPMAAIVDELRAKNAVTDAGRVEVGREWVAIEPTGAFADVQTIGALLLRGQDGGRQIHLRDVATVRRGYLEPPSRELRYDGDVAIGLGISTVAGGNVVTMGDAVAARTRELLDQIPLGIEFGIVSLQSVAVTAAIDNFTTSLVQAVAIVVVVLLAFMGLRSGLLIGFILVLTIAGSFIFLGPMEVALQRISLGALIIALGMLVDNAIVVTDGIQVRIEQGRDPEEAAVEVVAQTALPLFGATAVAILAFAGIGTSQDGTGEFCRSLYQVVLVSLSFSWLTAVTVTPLLAVMFLKRPAGGAPAADPYGGGFYRRFRGLLTWCIRRRWIPAGLVAVVFVGSLWGFGWVDKSFFPDSTRPQFMVDFWLPQGTHIDETGAQARDVETYLQGLGGVTHVTTLLGAGGLRFLLTYAPEKAHTSYAQFLVDVEDYRLIDDLMPAVERDVAAAHPSAEVYARRFIMGPGSGGKIQVRFSGPDLDELRRIADQAERMLDVDPDAKGVRTDWRQRVKRITPVFAEEEASQVGVTRPEVAQVIQAGFDGTRVGVYREGDELLPIVVRATEAERLDPGSMQDLQVWSRAAGRMIPLRQVVSDFRVDFEDDVVMRLNRRRTITVHADPDHGSASALLGRVRPGIEAIELPPGYELAWWGEDKSSRDAQAALSKPLPIFFLLMILIVIGLFDGIRVPLVIFLTVPLALIGVTAGLLATGQPFGFMALLGFLSLSGMLIKNAIVLIDEIGAQLAQGRDAFAAVVESAVSRLRPVAMAAATTALGMLPLLVDAFFVSMAVTIIAGLVVATVLTMIVVPTLYAIVFRVAAPEPGGTS
jgi:multidrug efflux pump subunit AcrB